MQRFVMDKLVEWRESNTRKPLLLMGARQVGKTWLMKEFGRNYYKKTAYISFYNNNRMKAVFSQDYDTDRIINSLGVETGVEITPGDTLIILDEIQNALPALESLKYFCEEANEYHVIAAGSLLGVAIHEGVSFPVGKVNILKVNPLSFREFLVAMGENGLNNALVKNDFSVTDSFSDKYLYWLKIYYYVGGMPEVVDYYRQHKDYKVVRDIQNTIIATYKGDFGKHVRDRELIRINMIWDSIPVQLSKENKKFFFGNIKKGARSSEYEVAVQWLADAGLVHKVSKVTEPRMPLKAYKMQNAYKLFVLDVGLLGALSELDPLSIIEGNEIFTDFKGALSEQYVLQQIVAETDYTPYYYSSENSTYEQDFLLQIGKDVIPIEVKSGKNVRSPSLTAYIRKYQPHMAVRFSTLPYTVQEDMVNIPLYAVCVLSVLGSGGLS